MAGLATDLIEQQEIEVGAADGAFRYWLAKEAVRQAELRLAAQALSLQALETRATTMLGWISAMSLAIAGVMATKSGLALLVPGIILAVPLLVAGWLCVAALWPREWNSAGHDPRWVMGESAGEPVAVELTVLEAMASSHGDGIEANRRRLRWMGNRVRVSWIALACMPVVTATALAAAYLWTA